MINYFRDGTCWILCMIWCQKTKTCILTKIIWRVTLGKYSWEVSL